MKSVSHPILGIILKVVLLFVGGGLLFLAYNIWSVQIDFIRSSIPQEGIVIELMARKSSSTSSSSTYAPVVEYLENGTKKTFVSQVSGNPSPYNVGEKVTIFMPKNGGIPQINSFIDLWFIVMMAGGFGVVITLISLLNIYGGIVGKKYQKRLELEGVKIQTNTFTVEESTYAKNETLTWRIMAQWLNPKDNKVYIFYSEDIPYNPKEFLKDIIDITLLPDDPQIYTMDISMLPEVVDDGVS